MEDRLQKFAHLVDLGSFTKTARALHISQPALSVAIKKLEHELKAELLVHGNRVLAVTPAGRLAYSAGKALVTHRDNLRQRMAELGAQKVPLALGMIDSVADIVFMHSRELDVLEQWAQVSLSINNSSLLTRAVLQHELDVAIIAGQPAEPNRLVVTALGAEPLVVVARADVAKQAKRIAQTGRLPNFLSYNQRSTTQQLVQAAALAHGVALEPSFYSTSPEIMLRLVLAGRGTAALPYVLVKAQLAARTLTPVSLGKTCLVERRITAIWHTNRQLPEALDATLAHIKIQFKELLREAAQLK